MIISNILIVNTVLGFFFRVVIVVVAFGLPPGSGYGKVAYYRWMDRAGQPTVPAARGSRQT